MKLIAQTPIKRDGKRIDEGQSFDCEDPRAAKQLIASASARSASDLPADEPNDDGSEQASWAARIEAIKAVIANMSAEDPEHKNEMMWRKDGAPRKQAVDDRLEFDLTADELADALKIIEEERTDG